MRERVRLFYECINTGAEWLCYALLGALVVLTSVQVFLRYVVRSPLSWSQEVSILLLVWFSMLVVAIGIYRDTHMVIRVVWERLGNRAQYVVNVGVELLTLAFAVNIVANAPALIQIVADQQLPASGLPKAWLYYSLPFGGVLMAFNAIGNILLDHYPMKSDLLDGAGM